MNLIFTANAEADLEEIGDYIAGSSPQNAVRFVAELRAVCEPLVDFPKAYPLTTIFDVSGIRKRVHKSYLIFYRVTETDVEILHIIHGARDYPSFLFKDTTE